MAVFSVASACFTCAPSTSLSRALQASKACQLQALSCTACGGSLQPFRAQRRYSPVVASQRDAEHSQTRVRSSGKARAVAEPAVLADEPALVLQEREKESGLRGEYDLENGSLSLEEMEAGEEDENGVELSEEAGEDGAISPAALQREVSRRRNFAIISHPDAGKTTLVLNR
jgi:hypothetical protein